MTTTLATQIDIDEKGVARIAGTRLKVAYLVLDKTVHNRTLEEIHTDHPRLTLAQIHAAFAYYYENQAAMDAWIEKDAEEGYTLAQQVADPVLMERLRKIKYSS